MEPKVRQVVYTNRETGETWVQEILLWSLAVECKIDCTTGRERAALAAPVEDRSVMDTVFSVGEEI